MGAFLRLLNLCWHGCYGFCVDLDDKVVAPHHILRIIDRAPLVPQEDRAASMFRSSNLCDPKARLLTYDSDA